MGDPSAANDQVCATPNTISRLEPVEGWRERSDMDALSKARPHMIETLNSFRQSLEDLGGGLGVTDPVSGAVVLALK